MALKKFKGNNAVLVDNFQDIFDKKIKSVNRISLDNLSSANGAVVAKNSGVCRVNVNFCDGTSCDLALKSKSQRTLVNGIMLLSRSNPKLRLDLILNHRIFGYNDSHRREINIYRKIDKTLDDNIIKYRGSFRTASKTYNILFNFYESNNEELTLEIAKKILDKILSFHILYYGNVDSAREMGLNVYRPVDYKRAKKCIYELYNSRNNENINLYGKKKNEIIIEYIKNIDKIMEQYVYHRTFTHNDFSTRNMFFNRDRILFYDFELSCYQNPEHDLIEFLMYDLGSFTDGEVKELIEYYKRGLKSGGVEISNRDFNRLLLYNTYEFIINRLSMTKVINESVELDFAKRSIPNSVRLLKIVEAING